MKNKEFSQKKYLKEKGRALPIYKCYVSDGYEEKGLTICLIIKKQPSGKFSFASILIDRFCLGVKNSIAKCNFNEIELEEIYEKSSQQGELLEVTPEYFHNLVYGAIDYAEELGFRTPKDFYMAEYLLDETYITDDIDHIEFGHKGKPLYIQGPYDNSKPIIATLNHSVGENNYTFIMAP